MKHLLVVVGLLVGFIGSLAHAEPIGGITTADAIAIHETVQAQLEAFANDDAAGAFELATKEKRSLIGSPANFMRLIREQYDAIYRHRSVIYSEPEVVQGSAVQTVRVTDSNSRVWVALFWMLQEDDSQWKIDGCILIETATVSV